MTWFSQALTILFVAFKLLGIIDWHWYWVLAPLCAEIAAVLIVWLVVSCCAFVSEWLSLSRSEKLTRKNGAQSKAMRDARAADAFESREEWLAKQDPPS